ncbi:MAG: M3 family oligoendopeptidase, partial [Ruminococcaceae bacterium]|nr:M3 family oligoendopeptidase [Oscillospiraceae bacterium]
KAPFIFSNFNGTSGDVDVLTHEAGHAFAGYTTRDFEFSANAQPTMESCECHSMSMEFFAWKWLDLFYGDDTDRAKYMHLESALIFIPYGCMVDHFQHIVYDNPDLTPAERHEEWLKLEKLYRPYMQFGDVEFYASGRGWQRQLHIYHYPFYYIDYCLAQTVSLEFWSRSQKDWADAWERYYKFVCEGGKKTFVGLCETADIRIPFEDGALKDIAGTAADWLK